MSVIINEEYAQPTAYLKRYSLRLDGFASLAAGFKGGQILTKAFTFTGKELEINYSTSAAGEVKVEILDEQMQPVAGFSMEEADVMIGNEIRRVVSWKGNTDVSSMTGKPVRLRIRLKDADLYSLKFN